MNDKTELTQLRTECKRLREIKDREHSKRLELEILLDQMRLLAYILISLIMTCLLLIAKLTLWPGMSIAVVLSLPICWLVILAILYMKREL